MADKLVADHPQLVKASAKKVTFSKLKSRPNVDILPSSFYVKNKEKRALIERYNKVQFLKRLMDEGNHRVIVNAKDK